MSLYSRVPDSPLNHVYSYMYNALLIDVSVTTSSTSRALVLERICTALWLLVPSQYCTWYISPGFLVDPVEVFVSRVFSASSARLHSFGRNSSPVSLRFQQPSFSAFGHIFLTTSQCFKFTWDLERNQCGTSFDVASSLLEEGSAHPYHSRR